MHESKKDTAFDLKPDELAKIKKLLVGAAVMSPDYIDAVVAGDLEEARKLLRAGVFYLGSEYVPAFGAKAHYARAEALAELSRVTRAQGKLFAQLAEDLAAVSAEIYRFAEGEDEEK